MLLLYISVVLQILQRELVITHYRTLIDTM